MLPRWLQKFAIISVASGSIQNKLPHPQGFGCVYANIGVREPWVCTNMCAFCISRSTGLLLVVTMWQCDLRPVLFCCSGFVKPYWDKRWDFLDWGSDRCKPLPSVQLFLLGFTVGFQPSPSVMSGRFLDNFKNMYILLMIKISLKLEWSPQRRSQKLQNTANTTQSALSYLQQG